MKQALATAVITLLLTIPALSSLSIARTSQPADSDEQFEMDADDSNRVAEHIAEKIQNEELRKMSLAGTGWHHHNHHHAAPAPAVANGPKHDAMHAKEAAEVAKQAAVVANRVAEHSIKITGHAKKALKHALGALHDARVDSAGLDSDQKASLKKAEARLREATKTADHGALKKIQDDHDLQKEKMEEDLDKSKSRKTEKDELREQIHELQEKLKGKKHDKDLARALEELEAELDLDDGDSNDEVKAELERLREAIDKLDDKEEHHAEKLPDFDMRPLSESDTPASKDATPVEDKGIDIDTQMPYGDLEPFGREDTAQELTESSIKESDEMVDQLERAEVAEEKRAVFRALTRLRGAAITSYDGVARSQSGNIDEYSKQHKWRKAHPLHHLADEESDVQKWAFPDNAD